MKRLLMGATGAALSVGLALAQTVAPATNNAGTSMSAPPASTMAPAGTSMGAPTGSNPAGAMHDGGKAAASGNDNQAVVTTAANADQPAKGANSFTRRQATGRIHAKGYTNVTGLKKDHDGVWRGMGTKDGASVQVWMDYKGNVGQQS